MKLVIVGGVAGGASAAARARRLDERAEIVLFERGEYVSFANCGLPYYIGGEIENREDLLVSTPEKLRSRFLIDVRTNTEVVSLDLAGKSVKVRDLKSGKSCSESYDKLILSPGAGPVVPPLPGADLDSVFTLRNVPDTDRIKQQVERRGVKSAVIVGGGFIGLEMAESLSRRGLKVAIIEMLDQVMAPLDYEMAAMIHNHLREKGMALYMRERVESFEKNGRITVVKTSGGLEFRADVVLLSIGVRPESELAKSAGLEVSERDGIVVDQTMRTSDPDVFAVGDAVMVKDFVSGRDMLIPLAGPANKQGRIAADNAMGRASLFKGVQGTSVVRVFDLAAATTGNSEKFLVHPV